MHQFETRTAKFRTLRERRIRNGCRPTEIVVNALRNSVSGAVPLTSIGRQD